MDLLKIPKIQAVCILTTTVALDAALNDGHGCQIARFDKRANFRGNHTLHGLICRKDKCVWSSRAKGTSAGAIQFILRQVV